MGRRLGAAGRSFRGDAGRKCRVVGVGVLQEACGRVMLKEDGVGWGHKLGLKCVRGRGDRSCQGLRRG